MNAEQDLQFWADAAGARLAAGAPGLLISGLSTDSRAIEPGQMFVALAGERFDGHDHLAQVWEKGAAAALVSRESGEIPAGKGLLIAPDTLTALQRAARAWRRKVGWRIIGITGSSGKTSTKDMLRAVIGRAYSVAATPGNLNNHIGVPLTLLKSDPAANTLICEMGTNHHGEIRALVDIAEPNLAVITNIGTAHIEHLGSREGIAREKGVLAESITPCGHVILNADDDFTSSIAARCRAPVLTAGLSSGDIRGEITGTDQEGTDFLIHAFGKSTPARIPVPGEHMVRNALLAAAAGYALKMDPLEIAEGLRALQLTGGRLTRKVLNGVIFLDDSYNANPQSMAAALSTLKHLPAEGRRIAVLGRMGELGPHEAAEHTALGKLAASLELDAVLSVGPGAELITDAAESALHLPDHASAAAWLRDHTSPGDLVLIKGSRSSRMERVPENFLPSA